MGERGRFGAREELRSNNEELNTLNEELRSRDELSRASGCGFRPYKSVEIGGAVLTLVIESDDRSSDLNLVVRRAIKELAEEASVGHG